MSELNIIHVAPLGVNQHQGLAYSIPNLIRSQWKEGANVTLLTTHPRSCFAGREKFPVIYYRDWAARRFFESDEGAACDLVHFHSTYIPYQAQLANAAVRRRIPYIITPRGGMTRGAMQQKNWKKRLGNLIFFSRMVRDSSALHFLTNAEANESAYWRKRHFVVGNGIDLPEIDLGLLDRRGQGRLLNFLFIGRLDIGHKGLDLLLDGLALCRERGLLPNLRLQIYGPDVKGSEYILRERIQRAGLEDWVELSGPVSGEDKAKALREADAFVLTSRFEGHPISVLEALSYGVPCLLTPGTNVADEIAECGAGWKVQGTAESIADGIVTIGKMRENLPEMARRARAQAAEHFGWNTIAQRTIREYEQVLQEYRNKGAMTQTDFKQ